MWRTSVINNDGTWMDCVYYPGPDKDPSESYEYFDSPPNFAPQVGEMVMIDGKPLGIVSTTSTSFAGMGGSGTTAISFQQNGKWRTIKRPQSN